MEYQAINFLFKPHSLVSLKKENCWVVLRFPAEYIYNLYASGFVYYSDECFANLLH